MATREMTKEELIDKAKELGIEVKGNWGIPKLTKEIAKATEEVEEVEEVEEQLTGEMAEENADKFLYQGKTINTDELLALLEKKLSRKGAVEEVVRIKRAKSMYASPIIGYVTHLNK